MTDGYDIETALAALGATYVGVGSRIYVAAKLDQAYAQEIVGSGLNLREAQADLLRKVAKAKYAPRSDAGTMEIETETPVRFVKPEREG